MELNIDPDWFLQMAEKEDNRIVSVGGFFTRVEVIDDEFEDEIYGSPLDEDDYEDVLAKLGCCMPGRRLMVGEHFTSDCHDAEMLTVFEEGMERGDHNSSFI